MSTQPEQAQQQGEGETTDSISSSSSSLIDSIASSVMNVVDQVKELTLNVLVPLEATSTSGGKKTEQEGTAEALPRREEQHQTSGSAASSTPSAPLHAEPQLQPTHQLNQEEHLHLPRFYEPSTATPAAAASEQKREVAHAGHSPSTRPRGQQRRDDTRGHLIHSVTHTPPSFAFALFSGTASQQALAEALGVDLDEDTRLTDIRHRVHDAIVTGGSGSGSKVFPATFQPAARGSAEAKHRANTAGLMSGIDGHKHIQQIGGRRTQTMMDGGRQSHHRNP